MEAFETLTAVAAPLLRDNVDTDAIIPSREMKTVGKDGLADGLFAGWRYRAVGSREPDPDFVLNDPRYAHAGILLAGHNFGCGSSREHAVWALAEYGFRVVVARSFNPIFHGNCVNNGVVPVEVDETAMQAFAQAADAHAQPLALTVDLRARTVADAVSERRYGFRIDDESRRMLLLGMDAIDATLVQRDRIEAFHDADRRIRPWVYL